MRLFLDIETIPTEDQAVIADLGSGISAPGNYKNPESIAKWEKENKQALVEEQVKKTAFDAAYGSICCIGYAWEGNDPITLTVKRMEDEAGLLCEFMDDVLDKTRRVETRLEVVGHNVPWDLRFIYQRCIIHDIRPPHSLMACIHAKPWAESIRDTMLMWNPERDRRISLEKLCRVLGVPSSKGEMDGSKVYEAYKAGEWTKIAKYCADDVLATRKVFYRLSFLESPIAEKEVA